MTLSNNLPVVDMKLIGRKFEEILGPCLAIDVLLFRSFAWRRPCRKHRFPYIVDTFLRGWVFTGRRIETAVLLLLSVFVAVRMFTDIYHNILDFHAVWVPQKFSDVSGGI
jgi:hypothetical protein